MGEQAGIDWYKMGKESMQAQLGTSVKDPLSGLDKITEAVRAKSKAKAEEAKAQEKLLKAERNKAGQKISNAFVEMGPTLKALGPESYTQCQNEVESLREEMYAAINNKDEKAIADVNVRLNELKTRHSADAENLTNFIDTYESKLVSSDAMTDEHQRIHAEFATNETKRAVYTDDDPPQLAYEWNVLDDNGQPVPKLSPAGDPIMEMNEAGELMPVYETDGPYTLTDMNDMLIMKDNVNGEKVMDYVQKQKEMYAEDPDSAPSNAAIKREMKKFIPQDKKQIRDWLHGSPAGADGLDVHGYLTDLLEENNNLTYEMLGINWDDIPDANNDGVKNGDDILPEHKQALIKSVMDVDDLEISHDIICEIYADISKNNIYGIEYNEETGEGNKNYKPEDDVILGNNTDTDSRTAEQRASKLAKLKSLNDKSSPIHKETAGMSDIEIARHLGFKDLNATIYNDETGERENIKTYIAKAKDKKAKGADVKTNEEYYNLIK